MKMRLIIRMLFLLMCPLLLTAAAADARIRFESTRSIQIDLAKLEVDGKTFYAYLKKVIHQNPVGLQAYGQVPFNICDMELNGRKLFDYQTTTGRKVRFMSNPSCDQMVLLRLLETSYEYQPENLSPYENRQCIRSIEGIFSPMLEYYTILFEEKRKPECKRCDEKERDRLSKISKMQTKMSNSCKGEQKKIIRFLNDLDETIENAFQSK